jgi:hypothetical protein
VLQFETRPRESRLSGSLFSCFFFLSKVEISPPSSLF